MDEKHAVLEHLAAAGKLVHVSVSKPTDEDRKIGDQEACLDYPGHPPGYRMGGGTCAPNAFHMIRGMVKQRRYGWQMVAGFATNPHHKFPIWHVWVRDKDAHMDPTWTCYQAWDGTVYRYYALPESVELPYCSTDRDSHACLKALLVALANEWNLRPLCPHEGCH